MSVPIRYYMYYCSTRLVLLAHRLVLDNTKLDNTSPNKYPLCVIRSMF